MKDELLKLKKQHHNARTDKQRAEIDSQMNALAAADPDAFAATMLELVRESADEAEATNLREQFREAAAAISLSYIAKTYFGKSREWLYQRINGYLINGKAAKFNDSELQIMRDALQDIENKLSSLRTSL